MAQTYLCGHLIAIASRHQAQYYMIDSWCQLSSSTKLKLIKKARKDGIIQKLEYPNKQQHKKVKMNINVWPDFRILNAKMGYLQSP